MWRPQVIKIQPHIHNPRPLPPSPAREDDSVVGAINNPAHELEIGVDLADFEDDEDNPIEIPDEPDYEDDDEEDDDEENEADSDDSALHELRKNAAANPTGDEGRDRELKRWIRNCRRECARRAKDRKWRLLYRPSDGASLRLP